jgi:hypothetical protein
MIADYLYLHGQAFAERIDERDARAVFRWARFCSKGARFGDCAFESCQTGSTRFLSDPGGIFERSH